MSQVEGGGVPAGTQLNGIYEVDKRVAMGGMGEVYIGHVVQTGDKVAIKMILPEHANNELILDLFRKEASTLHNLYHEAIVRYYVFSVDPVLNRPYLAMEYAEGPALGDRVRTYPLSEAEMSVMLPRIASGLHVAHRAGIVHRDLSPDNIILVGGDVNRAKIIDFGIAKSGNSEGTLIGSGFAGKLKYVSPEQLGMGGGEVTAQSDIYSLGLVLAEASIGQPLDMGGSQVEVIDKRRVVPDLSAVPAYVRPLINWMLQPNPSDRPASMEVVANWTPSTPTPAGPAPANDATMIAPGGFAGAQQNTAPPPPTTPAPQQAAPPPAKKRRRGPLPFLSLLFSGTAVAGVIAAVVLMSQPDPKGPDTKNTMGTETTDGVGTKTASSDLTPKVPDPDKDAKTADGKSDPELGKTIDGSGLLEPKTSNTPGGLLTPLKGGGAKDGDSGLTLGNGGSGDVNTGSGPAALNAGGDATDTGLTKPETSGAPVLGGGGSTLSAPDGGADGSAPTLAGGDSTTTPTVGDTSTPTLSGGDSTTGPSLTKAPVADGDKDPASGLAEPKVTRDEPGLRTPGADNTDLAGTPKTDTTLTPGGKVAPSTPGGLDANAGTGAGGLTPIPTTGAPKLGGGDTPGLTTPGADGSTPTIAGLGDGGAPDVSGTKTPSLDGGGEISGPSLTKAPVTDADPADALKEPTVTKSSPGGLSAPSALGGPTSVGGGDDGDGFALPRTGGGAAPSTPSTPGGGTTELAAVAKPKNQPPTIRSRAPSTLSANQGQSLNVRLGEFFDEDGAVNLKLKIQGDVPNGLTIRMVEGGIAEMFGTPAEYGNYNIKVAAIDSEGLISASITVALSVERPVENRKVRDYILAYQGGDCFLSRPTELGPQLARIEIFASKDEIPRIYEFDSKFKVDNGFEAKIGVRLITADQCELVRVLDQIGAQALDNSLVIRLIKDQLLPGDTLTGKVKGGRGSRLFLFDNLAGIADLSGFVREEGGETGFSVPISGGNGPQILIAARPRDGSGVSADASLNQLLAAAQQGKASLALGFFILK